MLNFQTSKKVKIRLDDDDSRIFILDPGDVMLRNRLGKFVLDLKSKQNEIIERSNALEINEELEEGELPSNLEEALAFNSETAAYFIGQFDDIFGPGASEILFGKNAFNMELMLDFLTFVMNEIEPVSKEKIEKRLGRPIRSAKAKK